MFVIFGDGSHWLWDTAALLLIPALVVLNGLFVAAEFSLVSVRKTRIEELIQRGADVARLPPRRGCESTLLFVFRAATGIEPSVWAGSRGAVIPAEGRHRKERPEYRCREWPSQARSEYLLVRILRIC